MVSTLSDHAELNEAREDAGLALVRLPHSVEETIVDFYQDTDVATRLGMTSGSVIDMLGKVMSKYEIPIGMLNSMTALVQYWTRFLIDDSGSMNDPSDVKCQVNHRMYTRWEETKMRLLEMVEILAHVPSLGIEIRALNRGDIIRIPRET